MRCCASSSTGSPRQRLERDMNESDGVPSSMVSMKVASSALEVPVVTPWMAGPHSAGDDPVIVSVTDFVTRRRRDGLGVIANGLRMRMGWYAMSGAVGLWLWTLPVSGHSGSISVWASEADLQ